MPYSFWAELNKLLNELPRCGPETPVGPETILRIRGEIVTLQQFLDALKQRKVTHGRSSDAEDRRRR